MSYLFQNDDLDGATNMALDEVLWAAAADGTAFMRLYTWSDRPVLSLGYFQNATEVRRDPRLGSLPFVRRLTGGGAIVHDDEITYSIALPGSSAPRTNELYERIHTEIARRLREHGLPASVPGQNDQSGAEPDLCFARADRWAVRVGGVKVLGSAQRRRPGSVLLHGSLILGRSAVAPEIVGLRELVDQVPGPQILRDALAVAARTALNVSLVPMQLPETLRLQSTRLADAKYRTRQWNEYRQDNSTIITATNWHR